ncbi:hypothetical protein LDVICp080 [lymphocystis disease virus-China]|uniref:Uncharacterized protein n=1 Tax=lymphocystis disease virus-China TaxID=256729 RepID=Q678D1_9VIRU|nr:hypothetical protein LDVICp080 [lymphocystis disease virus-China]AAU10925.1 hypothetical protein [lymphocystis disease virus-China]
MVLPLLPEPVQNKHIFSRLPPIKADANCLIKKVLSSTSGKTC